MDRPHNNPFLEPERSSGVIGWAANQLALWLAGGCVVYFLLANHLLFRGSADTGAPVASARLVAAPHAAGQPAYVTNSLTLAARADGHVLATAEVNGVPVRFVVDTGATWVSLSDDDAARAGVAGGLDYSTAMTTANGVVKGAPVTLRSVRIDQLEVDDVAAMVMPGQQGISLLGQSFLSRLQSYEMRDGVLTLTWN